MPADAPPRAADVIAASICAGWAQHAALHPLDTLKARLQYAHEGGTFVEQAARALKAESLAAREARGGSSGRADLHAALPSAAAAARAPARRARRRRRARRGARVPPRDGRAPGAALTTFHASCRAP
jgi:hypothetical protein